VKPILLKSGISDFKNNRNYLKIEQFEEYSDGTLLKKIVHDNGYGNKILEESGCKLDLDKLPEDIKAILDDNGCFLKFIDSHGNSYKTL